LRDARRVCAGDETLGGRRGTDYLPPFVSYGEGDYAESTTKEFYDRLTVPKRFLVYREADGAGGHCEGMGQSRYFTDLFAWLGKLW